MFTSGFPIIPPNSNNPVVSAALNSWNQHPPESMPWSSLPHHRVTRFSGELDAQEPCAAQTESLSAWNTLQDNWKLIPLPSPLKRKIDEPSEEQVRKQLITEDKISAHLSQLQICSSTSEQPRLDAMEDDSTTIISSDSLKIDACSKLILSDEIRNFQHENSIPQCLLENFNRPSMAVVLWQPRSDVHQLVERNASPCEEQSRSLASEALEGNPTNDLELINEEESNNNEPINNFNLNDQHQPDLEMDDDL
ncbi:uncharacterized protein LOC130696079 [Daphnia carinata]|uniref:uncharacterized protein LOC130696079 n=1 Tax=Daphnia carinata TaxID=120202 RepID=UPI0025798EF7|nr:uncharacterized protein LOC130696079 [Daphnia carinata]